MKKRRRRSNFSGLAAVAVLIVLGVLAYYGFQSFSAATFQPSAIQLIQYAGNYELSDSAEAAYTSRIGPYRVETKIYGTGCYYSEPYCLPNSCGGTEVRVADGCSIWRAQKQVRVWKDCVASASTMYLCDCRKGDAKKCYDPFEPNYKGWKTSYETETTECGGQKTDSWGCRDACWSTHDIYLGEQQVFSSGLVDKQASFKDDGLVADVGTRRLYVPGSYGGSGSCGRVDSQFAFVVPKNAIKINLSGDRSEYVKGEEAAVTVGLTNNYREAVFRVQIMYAVPTAIGDAQKTETYTWNVPVGYRQETYTVPTAQVADVLKVSVRADVLFPGADFAGINGLCYGQADTAVVPLSRCEFVKIGEVTQATRTVRVRGELPAYCVDAGILSAQECDVFIAKNIGALNLDIDRKAGLIRNMTEKLEEQGRIVSDLNMTLEETASLISRMEVKLGDLHKVLAGMNNTVAQNIALMKQMELTIADQVAQIERLSRTQKEKDDYISSLLSSIKGQDDLIAQLEATTKIQASQIASMEATIEEKARVVARLSLSIEEKEAMIAEMRGIIVDSDEKLAFMAAAVEELGLDNADLKRIINRYQSTIEEDAKFINSLSLSNAELAIMVEGYKDSLEKQARLVGELRLENERLSEVVRLYEVRLLEQQQISGRLSVGNEELNGLVASYRQGLLEAEELVGVLGRDNEELAGLVFEYEERLGVMADYVSGLRLSEDGLRELVVLLNSDISYQKELLGAVTSKALRERGFLVGAGVAALLLLLFMVLLLNNKKRRR